MCALERLLAALEAPAGGGRGRMATFALAGALASLAAVTRYDAWLALPIIVLAAWIFVRQDRRALASGLAVFSLCAASLPVAWLAWGARAGGDPLFFAHYIMTDHAGLAADVVGRFGPVLGRARQIGIWTLAFVAAMTLPGVLAAVAALARAGRTKGAGPRAGLTPSMRVIVVAALGPPVLYLARGLLLQSFEPLARFALIPGALLLPLAAAAVPVERAGRFRAATAAAAVGFSLAIWLVATVGRDRIWAGAESMGALTRLDAEDREPPAARAGHDRAARLRRDRRRARRRDPLDRIGHADRHARAARHRGGEHARDRRAVRRRLRPTGRDRLAAPTARLASAGRSAPGAHRALAGGGTVRTKVCADAFEP